MNYKKKYLKYKKKYLKSKYSGGTEENDDEYDDDFERDPDFNIKYIQEKIKNIDITNANELLTLIRRHTYTDVNITKGVFNDFDEETLEKTLEILEEKIEPLKTIQDILDNIKNKLKISENNSTDCIIMDEDEDENENKNEDEDEDEDEDELKRTNTIEQLVDILDQNPKDVYKGVGKKEYNIDESYKKARRCELKGDMFRY